MTREQVLDVVSRWQRALNGHDPDALAELYSEKAETHSPLGGSVTGREAISKVLTAFLSAFSDASFAFQPAIIDEGRVALVAEITGTQDGPLLGLPPSGRAFRIWSVFVLELEDGLIVNERRIYDFTGLLIQLGTLKAKPA